MQFSLACNWDKQFVAELRQYQVKDVFGKLPLDIIGGGRPAFLLPQIDRPAVEDYIREVHAHDLEFTYLLNAPCAGGREFTSEGHRELLAFMGWLSEIGVDRITVGTPFLLQFIKRHFPHIQVAASVYCHVDSIRKARILEDMGVDLITLSQSLTRNSPVLKALRKAVKCELQIYVNNTCLHECPFQYYHANTVGHSTEIHGSQRGFFIDYCYSLCTLKRLSDPVEFIRGDWVRPEDLHYYEQIGYTLFKLADRKKSSAWLRRVVSAYSRREYCGNLVDLVPFGFADEPGSEQVAGELLNRPDLVKRDYLKSCAGKRFPLYIDNKALDGFLEEIMGQHCELVGCRSCTICQRWAERSVRTTEESNQEALAAFDSKVDNLIDGTLWPS
ncbi:MAG: U32 family peptidase [bacterium]